MCLLLTFSGGLSGPLSVVTMHAGAKFCQRGTIIYSALRTYTANFFLWYLASSISGHNPVARLIISLFFILLSMQAITGLVIAGTDLYYPPFGGYFAEWVTDGDPERLKQLRPGDKSQVVESAYAEMRAFRKPFITVHVYMAFTCCRF